MTQSQQKEYFKIFATSCDAWLVISSCLGRNYNEVLWRLGNACVSRILCDVSKGDVSACFSFFYAIIKHKNVWEYETDLLGFYNKFNVYNSCVSRIFNSNLKRWRFQFLRVNCSAFTHLSCTCSDFSSTVIISFYS